MNRILKKLSVFIFALIFSLSLFQIDTRAAGASVTIALSSSSASIGGSITATVNVSGSDISAYTIYVSYNSSVLEYSSASGSAITGGGGGTLVLSGTGAGSTSLTFKAIANGSSGISTSGSDVYDINGNQISISHAGVNVSVSTPDSSGSGSSGNSGDSGSSGDNSGGNSQGTETTTEDNGLSKDCSLKSLQVSPGTLSPAFSSGTTNYTVRLDADAESIVVSATANDEKASTSVSGANSLSPGENSVRVTVTAENGAVRVYRINVICGEVVDDLKVNIGGIDYSFINDASIPDVPEDFTDAVITYSELEIPAYQSPNGKLSIVCLVSEESDPAWYIYNEENQTFIPYAEYSSAYVRYVILEMPEDIEIPDNYHETQLVLGDMEVKAYTVDEATGIFLLYAMNLNDEEGLYFYDTKEQSFMRYVDTELFFEDIEVTEEATPDTATPAEPVVTPETPGDEGIFTKDNLFYMLIGAGALAIIFLIVIIVLGVKNSKLNNKLADMEFEQNRNIYRKEAQNDAGSTDALPAKEEASGLQEATEEKELREIQDIPETQDMNVNGDGEKAESFEQASDFVLEEADETAEPVTPPETYEKSEREIRVEEAIKERPYGIDSAFEVVPEGELKPEDGQKTDITEVSETVEAPDSGIEIPHAQDEED